MENTIMINYINHENELSIPLDEYCNLLSKRNQVVLYKLEEYLNKDLRSDNKLQEIRSILLSVSGDIKRLSENISLKVE